MRKFYSIEDIKRHSENTGNRFFEAGATRFFASRYCPTIHPGGVFVTSEKGPNGVRAYTLRQIMQDGSILSISAFQQYSTSKAAHTAAKAYCQKNGLTW